MRATIYPRLSAGAPLGPVRIPASKSHTIRRLLLAWLGEGVSEIRYPLDSLDARSCMKVCRALGAEIEERYALDPACPNPLGSDGKKLVAWIVRGIGLSGKNGSFKAPATDLDVGNSGTTLFLALTAASLGNVPVRFTGDEQIARRSAGPLLDALSGLGVGVESANGCVPITVQGPWKGGRVSISCPTSQYLSALLLAAPLAPAGLITDIDVPLINEIPYIEMTLSYLKAQGAGWEAPADFSRFRIPGGASYKPMNGPTPGDFSSAAFPGGVAAITGFPLTILGLDPEETQGDKAFFDMIARMGCDIEWKKLEAPPGAVQEWSLKVSRTRPLKGAEFDLNATPDILPMLAVTAAYAEGDTALVNVAHARIKETDRIAVMAEELGKLGVSITERPDGMVIHGKGGGLKGGRVDSRGDHRIVMALAAGALGAAGPVEIEAAESAAVTYPGFLELLGAVW
ncbi:3-phosphoshikimate 1-carboxyvinyltransferase [Treponema primitia ZAS-2]|uniref:3-phosphoshikimate 1-carboxyvinyltransferase n=1 Tax=Treponema primitia (strain ATCC BAA-887 / DSM 12427 / ZAS-2) TaxID=545694 RepID=F5YKW6_TREPZ|nr:3-phosphoshikimate 1-carboxyvinyltransferase [Treponema primitia]AEF85324.1 3-phosphoshikimate 1-carboxyvinyltransferase [Treponema primitia ZAS-2]